MTCKFNVYTPIFGEDNDSQNHDGGGNEQCYGAFNVNTDNSEVLVYASNMRPTNGKTASFLPGDE
jgi:hypothetical protein